MLPIPKIHFVNRFLKYCFGYYRGGVSNLYSVIFHYKISIEVTDVSLCGACDFIKALPCMELAFLNICWLFIIALYVEDIKMDMLYTLSLRNSWSRRLDTVWMTINGSHHVWNASKTVPQSVVGVPRQKQLVPVEMGQQTWRFVRKGQDLGKQRYSTWRGKHDRMTPLLPIITDTLLSFSFRWKEVCSVWFFCRLCKYCFGGTHSVHPFLWLLLGFLVCRDAWPCGTQTVPVTMPEKTGVKMIAFDLC